MSKILFRFACGLFLFAAPVVLTGCEAEKPAAPAAAPAGPAAPGGPADKGPASAAPAK